MTTLPHFLLLNFTIHNHHNTIYRVVKLYAIWQSNNPKENMTKINTVENYGKSLKKTKIYFH